MTSNFHIKRNRFLVFLFQFFNVISYCNIKLWNSRKNLKHHVKVEKLPKFLPLKNSIPSFYSIGLCRFFRNILCHNCMFFWKVRQTIIHGLILGGIIKLQLLLLFPLLIFWPQIIRGHKKGETIWRKIILMKFESNVSFEFSRQKSVTFQIPFWIFTSKAYIKSCNFGAKIQRHFHGE